MSDRSKCTGILSWSFFFFIEKHSFHLQPGTQISVVKQDFCSVVLVLTA